MVSISLLKLSRSKSNQQVAAEILADKMRDCQKISWKDY